MGLKREARVWEPIPLETKRALWRFVLEAVLFTLIPFLVFCFLLVGLGGCAVQVTVTHRLESPIRCRADHHKNDLGFVCAPLKPDGPTYAVHRVMEAPPL